MAWIQCTPLEAQARIIRELLNNSKESRQVSHEAIEYFAALELVHPEAEAIRCYGLRRKVQRNGKVRCAALLNSSILAAKVIQLWAILRDANLQRNQLREEFYALGPAFHCSVHATATDHGRFAQKGINVCLRFRDIYGIGLTASPSQPAYPADYIPPALLPYAAEAQTPASPSATTVALPTPPTSPPETSDTAILQAAFEEMLDVQQNPRQASTAAWMQALHVADHILKQAGVTIQPPLLFDAVGRIEQGASYAQLGPLEQSTLLFALRRAKGCFEHGI